MDEPPRDAQPFASLTLVFSALTRRLGWPVLSSVLLLIVSILTFAGWFGP